MPFSENQQIIETFYQAFQRKDFGKMQSLYHEDAVFSDPVFQNLNANEVRAMWQMLLTSSSDLRIEFRNAQADLTNGTCHWEAWYTFSKTKRPVHNVVEAGFDFSDGKIIRHTDTFDFWRWSRQALGFSGLLLGWSNGLQSKVQTMARQRLEKFLNAG